jgi:hypothetical protein
MRFGSTVNTDVGTGGLLVVSNNRGLSSWKKEDVAAVLPPSRFM